MRSDSRAGKSRRGRSRDRLDVVLASLLVAVAAAVLAGFAWTRPSTVNLTVPYEQSGSLSYTTPVSSHSVYGTGRVTTGQPVYLSAVRTLDLSYDYRFASSSLASLSGTEQLVATMSDGQGLTRSIQLQPVSPFRGESFVASARLPLARLSAVAAQFDKALGSQNGTYSVQITPSVKAGGTLARAVLRTRFDGAASFEFTGSALVPASAVTGSSTASSAPVSPVSSLQHVSTGAAETPGGSPAVMFGHLSVADVRLGALVVLLLALLVGLRFALPLLGEFVSSEERVRIAARYGPALVEIDMLGLPTEATLVQVSSFDGVLQVAKRLECPILHESGEVERYVVVDNGTVYEYPITTPSPAGLARVAGARAALMSSGNHSAAHAAGPHAAN